MDAGCRGDDLWTSGERYRERSRESAAESSLESDAESDVESGLEIDTESGLAAIWTSKCDLVTAFITSPEHCTRGIHVPL